MYKKVAEVGDCVECLQVSVALRRVITEIRKKERYSFVDEPVRKSAGGKLALQMISIVNMSLDLLICQKIASL